MLQGCTKKIQLQCLLRNLALELGRPHRHSHRPGTRLCLAAGSCQRISCRRPLPRKQQCRRSPSLKGPVPLVEKTSINPKLSRQTRNVRRSLHPGKRR